MGRNRKKSRRQKAKQSLRRMKPQLPPLPIRRNVLGLEEVFDEKGELLGESVFVDHPEDLDLLPAKRRKEKVFRGATPLRRMYAQRAISDRQYFAGTRFNQRYAAGQIAPAYAGGALVKESFGRGRSERLAEFNDAAKECLSIMEEVGEVAGSILAGVVGQEMTIDDWIVLRARPNIWGRTIGTKAASWVLREALSNLVRIYDHIDNRKKRRRRSVRIVRFAGWR